MESTFHRKTSFNGGQNTGRIVDGEKPGSYGDKYPELEDIIIRDDTVENHVVEMLWCYREGRLSIHGFKALLEKANVESLMWKNQKRAKTFLTAKTERKANAILFETYGKDCFERCDGFSEFVQHCTDEDVQQDHLDSWLALMHFHTLLVHAGMGRAPLFALAFRYP
eukprot:TRINITY_DN4683_c0_g1_i2.p1 TRINITY_DN4683_c0_g1~~TRINITY_DN4683_c0_g1_i2.p1  ORF type:complete len:167 (-),score=20.43 TRINITY_DN4683_c0_g1_i2:294-794(-)